MRAVPVLAVLVEAEREEHAPVLLPPLVLMDLAAGAAVGLLMEVRLLPVATAGTG